ncbi:MAG TPA: EAL domain-containing protein [Pyrinomonadaceae bacterium]|nr:EAL domain-containing protein [Pyrinomonadaceae bacterium]
MKRDFYPAAVTAAGIALWLAAALSFFSGGAGREQLTVLALVPLVVGAGLFLNNVPLPSCLSLSQEKLTFTLSDALVLLIACRYGPAACVLVAGVEGFTSSRRAVRRLSSNLYSFGMMSLAGAAAAAALGAVLRYGFGDPHAAGPHAFPAVAVSMLAASVAHITVNSALVSVLFASRLGSPVLKGWKENFLLIAPMFLPTGAAASLMYTGLQYSALTTFAIGAPVLAAIHFGHRQYRNGVQNQIRLIERAQQERAEAERERAEQAERHVEELSHYVERLERASGQLEESREHFRHAAFHDALTGLPNRALLSERLGSAIARARGAEGERFALLFLDLDRFKNVNDSLGHTIGDGLLVTIARRLENSVRSADTVARLGGDEFAILLEGVKSEADAAYMAERVQREMSTPFMLDGHEVFMTVSIGIAHGAAGYEHPEQVLRDADTAMYRAKAGGRACFEVFDSTMHARAVNLLRLENDLRRAVEREEFTVYFQPIVGLATGRLAGFEALVRWQHPERGFIPPSEFIPVAEDTRLIVPLGLWVLREACRQVVSWQPAGPAPLTVSVNLSGRQFAQPDLVEQVGAILRETGLAPGRLRLEITESVVMEDAERAVAMLEQLKGLGVRLSIDDFGTGYSSLSYLHRFPLDTLKIDRSFVSQLDAGESRAELVRTIRTLAANMGLEVVAEGIETLGQLGRLAELGCEYGQGYLFARPLAPDAAEALVRGGTRWHACAAAARPPARDNVTRLKYA